MSESSPRLELNEDILLERDNSIPPPNIHKAADKSSDLVDTVELFKTILDSKLARSLAQVVGRIISMTPVIGNVARIMSKFCYMEIESRIGWDIPITGYKPVEVLSELKFWLENVTMINYRNLCHYIIRAYSLHNCKKEKVFSITYTVVRAYDFDNCKQEKVISVTYTVVRAYDFDNCKQEKVFSVTYTGVRAYDFDNCKLREGD
ncbi:unnamed protein product [Mytilus edulis]|uniref:Uncharacterized protein n=1 Tax=Mytilus edulis TaxID=6550 RepID=A0A8S3PUW2_MYTED|nr:unnamed protein product [Mytilus edulis]